MLQELTLNYPPDGLNKVMRKNPRYRQYLKTMGVIHHHTVIATVNIQENIDKVKAWIYGLPPGKRKRFCDAPAPVNGYHTFILVPDGSKEGWPESDAGDQFRAEFISFLDSFAYEDGSSNISWVEVAYGECGQAVDRGNNKNHYK